MSLKNLLVHVKNTETNDAGLSAAIGLARVHGARLTGLYVLPPPFIPIYEPGLEAAHLSIKAQRDAAKSWADSAKQLFRDATVNARVENDWIEIEGEADRVLIQQTVYKDMVVLGLGRDLTYNVSGAAVADRLIIGCGRPVLLVPDKYTAPELGKRIVVGWNGRREAARALNDAMPLLRRAEKVLVVNVGRETDERLPSDEALVASHLKLHNITFEMKHAEGKGVDAGPSLLSQAGAIGADLVVIGGYGHSRLREIILGGTTLYMIDRTEIPVLISH